MVLILPLKKNHGTRPNRSSLARYASLPKAWGMFLITHTLKNIGRTQASPCLGCGKGGETLFLAAQFYIQSKNAWDRNSLIPQLLGSLKKAKG
jgi:hypothetical protein